MLDIDTATIRNPTTGRTIKVKYALSLPHDHPAYKLARQRFPKAKSEFENPEDATRQRKHTLARMVDWHIQTGIATFEAVDDFCQHRLNGLDFTSVLTDYLDMLDVHDSGEIDSVMALLETYNNSTELTLEVRLTDDTSINRAIRVFSDGGPPSLSHEGFVINNRLVGKNIAKRMLRGSLDLADKIGAKEIHVHAGLDSGGYVWAKYGAVPTEDSLDSLLNRAAYILDDVNSVIQGLENQSTSMDEYLKRSIGTLRRLNRDKNITKQHAQQRAREILMKYKFNQLLKTTTKNAREYIANNPEVVSNLLDVLKSQLTLAYDQRNPYIVNILARGPLGKLMFLNSSWAGSFQTEPGSVGRGLFEDAIS